LSFWAKNRIEIDRKSKFGNRNITSKFIAEFKSEKMKIVSYLPELWTEAQSLTEYKTKQKMIKSVI